MNNVAIAASFCLLSAAVWWQTWVYARAVGQTDMAKHFLARIDEQDRRIAELCADIVKALENRESRLADMLGETDR